MIRKSFHHETLEVRRRELIDATLDCIAERGLRGTTVRHIAERAGVTGGLIRHYFASKDMLMQAAYADLMGRMTVNASDAALAGETPRARLCHYIRANFAGEVLDARLLSLWATFIGQIRIDPALAAIHRDGYLQFRDALETLIAEFQNERAGGGDVSEIRRQAIAINALIDGLWLEGCMASDLFHPGELADVALSGAEQILGTTLRDSADPFIPTQTRDS